MTVQRANPSMSIGIFLFGAQAPHHHSLQRWFDNRSESSTIPWDNWDTSGSGIRIGCTSKVTSPSGALRRILSWENNWVIFGVLTFLKLKSWYLTFLAGIYILRRMKLAGTNFLMPKVSRKACLPLCYQLNSWVPTLKQCSTNHPSTYAVNRLISWDPRFTYECFGPMTDSNGGYLKTNPKLTRLSYVSLHSQLLKKS